MPVLGFGAYQITDQELCRASVAEALKVGYRSIDTAAAYGNEKAIGAAIAESGIPRKDLFITRKLWVQDAAYDGAKKAFEASLKKLGLDYLDLYLIHQPFGDVYGAWRAIAGEIGKSAAQVVLRWLIQRGVVAIPKSVHPERIVENFGLFDFELSEENMKRIAVLDQWKSNSKTEAAQT